jgi:hypothetical protein
MIDLIEENLPLTVILTAAGVDSLHSLSRILPYVRGTDPAHAAALLRGGA